jgi:hypothetical protein
VEQTKNGKSNDDPQTGINELFKYQNIASEKYSGLDGIAEKCAEIGTRAALSKAFFYGYVAGKREERMKKKANINI